MTPMSGIFKILLLKVLILSVASRASVVDEADKIVDPEELTHLALPTAANSSFLLEWDDWDSWEAAEDVKNSLRYYRSGYDEDGLVVYIIYIGKSKYRELFQRSPEKVDEVQKYYEQYVRRAEADAARDNKGIVIICDYDGFSQKHFASTRAIKFALQAFTSFVRINHGCKYGFLTNVNYAAETFINLSKPFLGDILTKFETFGTRSEKWKPRILRKIAADQLPPEFGGSEDWKPLPCQVTKS